MKILKLFIIIVCIFISIPAFSLEKKRIAILDLQPKGTSGIIAGAATDMIRSELVKSGALSIVERTQMDEILKEQGFQTSGCTDQSCAVKIGKLVAAHKILIGELNKVGKSFIITIRTVDVEKGLSEHSANEKAESEDVIDVACRNISRKLLDNMLGKDKPYFDQPSTVSETGPETGYYLRGIVPGWAQIYSGHTVKGYTIGGIFLASAIWTTIAVLKYYNSKDDYESLESGLQQSKYNNAYDKYEKDGKIATYSLIGLGLIYAVNWVDVIFFSKPESTALGLLKYDNIYVNFNVNQLNTFDRSADFRTDLSATVNF